VTFQLNRPAGTTGYRISRRDLGDLTPAPIADSSFTHVVPLAYWTTYEYMFHGVLADGGCTTSTVIFTPPRPLTPHVTSWITSTGPTYRVRLSWSAQADHPTSYLVMGAGLREAGAEVPASNAPQYAFDVDNLPAGIHTWEVLPLWKTPTGNMANETGGRISATVGPVVGPRTIQLAGFTGSGISVMVGPRTIQLSGFTATGTSVVVGPRTIALAGWTANGSTVQGVVIP
jgi:hypothetical protein